MAGQRYMTIRQFAESLTARTGIAVSTDHVWREIRAGRLRAARFSPRGHWHVRVSELTRLEQLAREEVDR